MIDWSLIDTVLLDMDGTLLDLHFDNHFWLTHLPARYAEQQGIPEDEAHTRLHAHIESQRGTLNWYCLDYWSETLGLDIALLKREVEHLIQIRPHVEEFLQRLQDHDKQVWLLTNAHQASVSIKMERTRIDRLLNRIISSHEFEQPKESATFWQRFHARDHFAKNRTLFIDDTESVLLAAEQFGIAQLLCIRQPDSHKDRRQHLRFPAIDHFSEIMPPEIT